ncbi:MAG: hypothetical protein JO227_10105 [Acetobacteraceae bacterium]|nr:hypothetical protein [Acetobacteraceae bacterium]
MPATDASCQEWPPERCGFPKLGAEDRRLLAEWGDSAQSFGVDAIEDLGDRPWAAATPEQVIGIFETGHPLASWLIVGHHGNWAVAFCTEGTVSEAVSTLSEALALIRPESWSVKPL